jgi:3-phenylpropionate/trans-cinnamate dioxygenase ferredoxin reductase subunit
MEPARGSGARPVDLLVIGAGVAAARAVRTLRRGRFDGSIVVVGDETTPPYNRPPLSKELLRDDLPDDLVLAEPAGWYERHDVELVLGDAVRALDVGSHSAETEGGQRFAWTRALLAMGAEPNHLPFPGAGHALLLRTLVDARRIRAAAVALPDGAPVVVIGGGFIGVEVASSLAALGLRPTILEAGDALWRGALGRTLADRAGRALDAAGVAVRTRAAVTAVEPDAVLVGDERFPAALVVAGIGVHPREALADAAGLAVADGVLVDDGHRAGSEPVWAAGDVARVTGERFEHWHAARDGGVRAARSMLDQPLGPREVPWLFSEVAGIALDVVGRSGPGLEEEPVTDGVVAFRGRDRVAGIAVVGTALGADVARRLVAEGASVDDVRRALDGAAR